MITYREDFGLWWPDYDHKPEVNFALVNRRITDMDSSIKLVKERVVCVQAGGHMGLWPERLAKYFDIVYTFEPDPICFSAMEKNIKNPKIIYQNKALGDKMGTVNFSLKESAGSARVEPDGKIQVEQITIDSLQLPRCDLICLDVEGYEVEALKGAVHTINKFSPILHLEELPRSEKQIEFYVTGLGYTRGSKVGKDRIYFRKGNIK